MTIIQLFFALAGLQIAGLVYIKYYIDAKVDPIAKNVEMLVKYMIDHESRISRLEERVK